MSDLQPSNSCRAPLTQGSARLRNGFALARLNSTLGYYPEPPGLGIFWTCGPGLRIAAFGGVLLKRITHILISTLNP